MTRGLSDALAARAYLDEQSPCIQVRSDGPSYVWVLARIPASAHARDREAAARLTPSAREPALDRASQAPPVAVGGVLTAMSRTLRARPLGSSNVTTAPDRAPISAWPIGEAAEMTSGATG